MWLLIFSHNPTPRHGILFRLASPLAFYTAHSFNPAYSKCAWGVNELTCVFIKFLQLVCRLLPEIDFWWIWHLAKQLFRFSICQLSSLTKIFQEYRQALKTHMPQKQGQPFKCSNWCMIERRLVHLEWPEDWEVFNFLTTIWQFQLCAAVHLCALL